MKRILVAAIAWTAAGCLAAAGNDNRGTGIETQMKRVILKNAGATAGKDLESLKQTLHPESPGYMSTVEGTRRLMAFFDLKFEILSFSYVGMSDEYAVARGKQKTTKIGGPAFRDNIVDCLYIFRRDDGEWKLWTQTILETEFIGSPETEQ